MNSWSTMKTALLLTAALFGATPLLADDTGDSGGSGRSKGTNSPAGPTAPNVGGGNRAPDRDGVTVHLPTQFRSDGDLKTLIANAQEAQKTYVQQQTTLRSRLQGATTTERQRIIAAIQDNQQQFLDQTRRLNEEIRDRIAALKSELKNSKPIDAGAGGSTHPHRGH